MLDGDGRDAQLAVEELGDERGAAGAADEEDGGDVLGDTQASRRAATVRSTVRVSSGVAARSNSSRVIESGPTSGT
ncbi:hypothetical protein [Dactylosporangium darangshiense]|uniref:hypothetical protein n=1 Tax=Dactylosporangium darangshiense TaxID=579108 RepID=UPI00362ACEBC